MVSRVEYLGEDGWEHGFDILPGCDGGILDTGVDGREELYFIKCEADDSATFLYRMTEGQYTILPDTRLHLHQDINPVAMLQSTDAPYESSIFENPNKRRAIQITHREGC